MSYIHPTQNPGLLNVDSRRRLLRFCWRTMCALLLVLIWTNGTFAISLGEYRERVGKAIGSLDLLHETEEFQTQSQKDEFSATNLRVAREALALRETVEWNGVKFNVDNSWLEDELKEFEKLSASDHNRSAALDRILERLQALAERLQEIDKGAAASMLSKAELNERLAAVLQRPEYARTVKKESALSRLWRQFWKWISDLFPKSSALNPGGASVVSRVAQVFVLLVALAAIAYVLWKFGPRLLHKRKAKKTSKPRPRIVLGERLEPDQSAADLLAQAEALARAGDLRGAIRRGYIALLVELADRKIISLAQHKTNRDYLGAVREIQTLHRNLKTLTNSFEQHWYGLVPANDIDWAAFRAGYKEALQE